MKYRLTETEKIDSSYKHIEEFELEEDAQARMKELYKEYYENPAVEKTELNENSAIIYLNDGNEIEWDIENVEDIIVDAFEDDEQLSEDEMEERLKEVLGEDYRVSWFDSWISDGCDEEDEYVMGVGFSITDKYNNSTDVRIFYGNLTGKIGWVRVD